MESLKQIAVKLSSLRRRTLVLYSFLSCFCCAFLLLSLAAPVWATTPNSPSGLAAAALSSTQIKLTWTDNSSDETYFFIEYKKTTDVNFMSLTSVSANTTTYTHANLIQNTGYVYRVRAYNASGYSTYTNEASATTLTLNAPTNLSVSSVSYTQITLAWTDNSSDESGFYIERKTGAGGTYSQVGSVGANATTYTSTGMTQGTEYYFRVRAYGGSNYSSYTNEANATTPVLAAPSGLSATALSSTQIRLTWTDNSSDETYFYIEYKKATDVNFSSLTSVSANTATYTHTNLTQNIGYIYRVRAYHSGSGAYSAYSNEASATTLTLNAPTGLSVSTVSYTQITLTWTDNSSDETYFYVERKTGAGGTYAVVTTLGANTTTYTSTGMTQGTEYYFRVRAASGPNYSQYTNEANATTPAMAAPSGLSATALSSTQIRLTWTDNSTDETYFYIERKTGPTGSYSQIGSVSANIITYTNTGLAQNTEYYYRVRAYHSASGAYSAYTNEASATTLTLNAPTNLSITSASYATITLAWADNSSDETYFYVERKTGAGGTYSVVTTLGANTTTYTNTGLTQGTEYYYRVRAASGSNYSSYTNEVNATTLVLVAPSGLVAESLSSSQIRLTWADNSTDETNFYIERKTGLTGSYSQIGSVGTNISTYTNTGLAQNITYYYRVRAYHSGSGAYSAYSSETGATTAPFSPPSNLTAAALSSAQIKLTWTDNTNDETYFYIEYKVGASGTYTTLTSVSANTTTYTHANLTQNTTYYYRVRGYSSAGVYSTYSNEANAATPVFNAPSNLTAAPLSTTEIKLTWKDNSTDETNFSIEYKIGDGGTYTALPSVTANTTTYTHTGLTLGMTYSYRVRAYNGIGYSAYSNEAGVTTPECTQEGTYQP